MSEIQSIEVYDRKDFRKWLEKNHEKEKKVALVINKKHTGKSSPSHRELMEEAICFGWIDTTIKKLDEDKYIRYFARRNGKSKWSYNTLSYAKDLVKRKLMTPIGLEFYKQGLSRPTHDHGIPKNPDMPIELEKAFKENKSALKNFQSFSPSTKRTIYRWILRAKTPATREKRVQSVVAKAETNSKDIFGVEKKDI